MAKVDTSPTGGVGWRNLRTGMLFVAGIVLAGILGLIIGKNTSILNRHDRAYLFITDIKGLAEGNMVAIAGKKIGIVKRMDFEKRIDTSGVRVTLDIVDEFFGLITKDSKATVKALGVLGDKYVDISLGHSEEKLADGSYMQVAAEPGLEDLTASAIKTMNTIQDLSSKINKGEGSLGKLITTNELNDKLMKTMANVETMTNKITNGNGLLATLMNDESLAKRTASLITNLSDVSTSLKEGKGSLGKFIVDETFYNNLASLTQKTDLLFAKLNDRRSTLGKFANDPAVYDNLNRSIQSLDSLLIDLKENPGRYLTVKVF
jgi:phospholipid/cholesterol/gamma-HCH transport system substrate-binding protein